MINRGIFGKSPNHHYLPLCVVHLLQRDDKGAVGAVLDACDSEELFSTVSQPSRGSQRYVVFLG
jgi:hypothetical protein